MKLEALIAEFNNSAKIDLAFSGEVDLNLLSEKRREVQEAKRVLARLSVLLADVHAAYTLGLENRVNSGANSDSKIAPPIRKTQFENFIFQKPTRKRLQ